ncbi:MAG: CBASS oligonucleotide cyclase [Candidatus Binatia bacterium]
MATTIKQSFNEFSSNLEITDRQTGLVSERRKNVVDALSKELTLHSNNPSRLIGSYDRHTMTRYLSEGDVDVMVVLHYGNHKEWDTPEGATKALDRFRAILDSTYPDTQKRRDQNCITMRFSEFRLDVVPAFRNKNGYFKIPDSIRQEWVPTDPTKFAKKITDVNKTMESTFVPLIKMVKGWNREVGWPIRSFHLECLMYDRYETYTEGYTYPSMLRWFFNALPGYLASTCYDPVMGDRVDTYLDNNAQKPRREIAIEKAQAAAKASREAYEAQEKNPETAIKRWKNLMGEFFPAYG